MLTRRFRIHFPLTSGLIRFCLGACFGAAGWASAQTLDPLVVSVARDPLPIQAQPYFVELLSTEALDALPAYSLDDKLKRSAAFSLFRRTGSLSANPTAQGVSLRNMGPNGAGRTLVLMDGIPLNDPFGGWVAWAKAPALAPRHVEIVRGSGSGVWGSAALGGIIQVVQDPNPSNQHALRAEVGDFGTIAAAARSTWAGETSTVTIDASGFHNDGFRRKAPQSAGPIDTTTDLEQAMVQAAWAQNYANGLSSRVTFRAFAEDRGNGTPLQANRTREALLSAELAGGSEEITWSAQGYFQTQEYRSLFTAVDDTRSSERPVLDQYSVPADAAGGAFTMAWGDPDARSTLGLDGRWVEGETQENYFRVGDEFTRNRRAGGEQLTGGIFVTHNRELAEGWRLDAALRLDEWALQDGQRIERNRQTGATTREEIYDDRSDTEFSPRVGLVWDIDSSWRWTAAAYQAFRLPTLNEFYRPFRVGSVITEANPLLEPEHLTGAETSIEWQSERASWRAGVFATEIKDAVANVTLGFGPGFVPGVGFVPNGGVGRQRQNLDQVSIQGVELGGSWQVAPEFSLRADYLYSDARDDATDRWLAQVPRHTVVVGATLTPNTRWQVDAQVRHVSDAFENDSNTLVLDAATTLDLRIAYRWGEAHDLFLAVENLTDEDVVSGRDAAGNIDLGTPRFIRGGATWRW